MQMMMADGLHGETTDRKGAGSRYVVAAVMALAAVVVAVAIFMLTEQTPDVTSAESGFVNDFLVELLGGISGIYDAESGLWLGIGIRHWAHVVEFGVLGLFVAIASFLACRRKPLALSMGLSFAVCIACSVFDQCHKLFVPGRHFDWFDLAMDALGYATAIVVVLAIAIAACRHDGKASAKP